MGPLLDKMGPLLDMKCYTECGRKHRGVFSRRRTVHLRWWICLGWRWIQPWKWDFSQTQSISGETKRASHGVLRNMVFIYPLVRAEGSKKEMGEQLLENEEDKEGVMTGQRNVSRGKESNVLRCSKRSSKRVRKLALPRRVKKDGGNGRFWQQIGIFQTLVSHWSAPYFFHF